MRPDGTLAPARRAAGRPIQRSLPGIPAGPGSVSSIGRSRSTPSIRETRRSRPSRRVSIRPSSRSRRNSRRSRRNSSRASRPSMRAFRCAKPKPAMPSIRAACATPSETNGIQSFLFTWPPGGSRPSDPSGASVSVPAGLVERSGFKVSRR
ncbi:MAG: hypothetical protein F4Y71_03270 [Acidobacteria bacterium]|nr:hypothetical protein [Acidobacteriota bacterium]MYG76713.1 hypothetical protein [Acidobacteriota bacterium]